MTTIKDAVADLFDRELPVDEALDRHHAPGFRQRIDGTWSDRVELLARVVALREAVERATITVLDELADGDRYAERHIVDLVQRDGARVRREVYVFAERDAEGRFVRIEEVAISATDSAPR